MTTPEFVAPTVHTPRRRNGRLILFGLIGLCLLFAVAYFQRSEDMAAATAEIAVLQAQIAHAKQQQAVLQDELKNIAHPSAIDAAARNDLGLIQPGDQPIVVLTPQAPPTPLPVAAAAQQAGGDLTNWQRWLDLLWAPAE